MAIFGREKPSISPQDSDKSKRRKDAAKDLTIREILDASKPKNPTDSTEDLADSESAPDSLYKGTGRSSRSSRGARGTRGFMPGQQKAKGKGLKNKLTATIVTIGIIMSGAVAMNPGTALIERLTQYAPNSQRTETVRRMVRLFNKSARKDITESELTNNGKYDISSKTKSRLAEKGIEIEEDGISYKGEKLTSSKELTTKYETDSDYRGDFDSSTRSKASDFYDGAAEDFFEDQKISRNAFKDYKTTGDDEVDEAAYEKTRSEQFADGDDVSVGNRTETKDEDGNTSQTDEEKNLKKISDEDSSASSKVKAQKFINALVVGINSACAVGMITSTIASIVSAVKKSDAEISNTSDLEVFGKTKAGYGNEAGINYALNDLSKSQTAKVTDFNQFNYTQLLPGNEIPQVEVTGSALEDEGMLHVLSNGTSSFSQQYKQLFSLESINSISKQLFTPKTCAEIGVFTAGVSVVLAFLPGGKIITGITKLAKAAAASIAVSLVVAWIVPTVADIIIDRTTTTALGKLKGRDYALGGNSISEKANRSSNGAAPSSKDAAIQYAKATSEVLAMDAEIDRKNRSPFDITNPNTFFGTIYTKFLPSLLSSSTVSTVSSFAHTASSSFASIFPSVYAEESSIEIGDCPTLDSIGVVGDALCVPIASTDFSTIDLDPGDPQYLQKLKEGGLEIDPTTGKETIKKDSELYKYVNYCTLRQSPFGTADANIADELKVMSGITTNTLVQAIPFVNDIADFINNGEDLINQDWITGKACVNSKENDAWNSKYKYYQRYITDTRLMNRIREEDKQQDSIALAREEYRANNPLYTDDSYTAYLARISGVTKSDVEVVIAIAEEYKKLENYDPSKCFAFGADTREDIIYDFQSEGETYISLLNPVIFDELRYRSYAA